MADRDFPHASILEGVRFTAQVAVPNVIQGLFRRRRHAVAVATRTGSDGLAYGFMASLKRSYGNGPLWIRVAKDEALLVLGEEAIRKVLERSPDPFAPDPEPKRSGMAHFQPHALTISRGPVWEDRRRFTEYVLAVQPGRVAAVAAEEAGRLPEQFGWEQWNAAVRRIARRVILGDSAAADAALSELLGTLMDKSNPPGSGDDALRSELEHRLAEYAGSAEQDSLVARFINAPHSEQTDPVGQLPHWLFAFGDTLAANSLRCLALLVAHDEIRERALAPDGRALLGGCLLEAMRLWPTTPMLSRELLSDIEWSGIRVPKGTQLLIVNSFNHRDREALDYADRFAPEEWLEGGDARDRWQFNHLSHGPQDCPGADISVQAGAALIGTLLRGRMLTATGASLDPAKPLPHALDFFALSFTGAS